MSQRRQLTWANVATPGTANKLAGWDASGNPVEKDSTAVSFGLTQEIPFMNTDEDDFQYSSLLTFNVATGLFKVGDDTDYMRYVGGNPLSNGLQIVRSGLNANASSYHAGGIEVAGGTFFINVPNDDLTIQSGANIIFNSDGAGGRFIIINDLETSAAGLPSNALWLDGDKLSLAP